MPEGLDPEHKVSFHVDASAFTEMLESFKAAMEPIGESFSKLEKTFKQPVFQQDFTLQPGITAEQIAKAFDVPLEALGIVSTDEAAAVAEQMLEKLKIPTDCPAPIELTSPQPETWATPSSDPVADLQKAIAYFKQKPASMTIPLENANPELLEMLTGGGPVPLKDIDGPIVASGGWIAPPNNHASGLAMDFNAPVGKPIPGEMYLEGSGDPFDSLAYPKVFNVLGKAEPVVVSGPAKKVWETELGKLVQAGGICHVSMTGLVSTAKGSYQLGGELGMTDLELAKKLIGVIPNDGPGTGIQVLEQTVDGQTFTWEAGTGWIPKQPDQPLYAVFPEVSTAKSGLKFTIAPKPSSWETTTVHGKVYEHPAGMPPKHPVDGTQHTGPDGAIWEFRLAGGWRVVEYPPGSTASSSQRAPYGWWCSFCGDHWTKHGGDPVACESGGWLRPATSAEHKLSMIDTGQ